MIGKKDHAVEEFWRRAKKQHRLAASAYHVGTFADPRFATYHDLLLDLVGKGMKRGTAHMALDFERNHVPRREVGDYWVVVTTTNEPRYLVRVTDVEVKPFNKVEVGFASREGEGDSSLEYWRKVHREYFVAQCSDWGIAWSEDMPTVCEGFELVASA